jgi:hypothetical protein
MDNVKVVYSHNERGFWSFEIYINGEIKSQGGSYKKYKDCVMASLGHRYMNFN